MIFKSGIFALGVGVLGLIPGIAASACSSSGARTTASPAASPGNAPAPGPVAHIEAPPGADSADAGSRIPEIIPLPDWDSPEVFSEKWLYLDIRNPDGWKASWREARVVLLKFDVPSDKASARAKIAEAWGREGSHRATTDQKSDHAVILVGGQAAPEDILKAVDVLRAPTRDRESASGSEVVPVFEVTVSRADDPAFKRKPWSEPNAGRHAGPEPSVRFDVPVVAGRLSPEVVSTTIQSNADRIRRCYRAGLAQNPTLSGMVAARFVIDLEGTVHAMANGGSDLRDAALVTCIASSFGELVFPAPEGGIVTVIARVRLEPRRGK